MMQPHEKSLQTCAGRRLSKRKGWFMHEADLSKLALQFQKR